MKEKVKKVVLAYSGGLDTSVIVRWLIDTYGCEVVAFVADVGQEEELHGLKEKGVNSGASKVIIEDLREEFVRDFVFPMLRANAVYEGGYLMGTSIARPLIAKRQVEIAAAEGADAVSHGATGKGNDQVRFELTYMALNPRIKIIAPWQDLGLQVPVRSHRLCRKARHSGSRNRKKPYSSDRNLLHISFEGGILEDPWLEPMEEMFILSKPPEKAPDQPVYVEIDFESRDPGCRKR